ncbi:MAG: rod shape-determining protein MreD [Ignavibacteria bacterium RIFOXYA12_FULL_35_25]|nr:MAG: rod shape-determining protein MreD [Ignavibacteria bacterium GWF2_35_20]OGU82947.1 MAG: rod shape-determining protein MreD [Ignavibacteria bacterium RBG_16_35_7]OGU88499.1 MAG: rod shape-determining protein MreD [Ignavibacteria bacterium RIFOXYC12_FULL_35_11]OGU91300.1 MAG: rod shape-determining protein MreD [Ignavibacteria bacterium RIFOXYA12_FULL_35_25]OGU96940.1 MAG: rod shape-determining protein MreD [Ignavibacteria bacterium RIFOXYB12_FULL_35_14]OGV30411.1 MAG: rod shape-determini
MMRVLYIFAIILFFPLLLLQSTLVPLISIVGIIPDLILILLVYFTLRMGQIHGTVLGFIYGFLLDMITGNIFGSAMISKTISGFVTGYFYNENKLDFYFKSFVFSLIVLLSSTIDSFVFSFFSSVELEKSILLRFFEQGMFPGIYTAIISLVLVMFHPRRNPF